MAEGGGPAHASGERKVSFSGAAYGAVSPPDLGESSLRQMKSALSGIATTPAHTQPAAPHASAARERPAGRIPRAQREQLRAAQQERLRAANAAAIAQEQAAADKVAAEADVAVIIVQDMFQREAKAKARAPSKRRK